jgi:tetratricopeptide (TPR) repeat protein
MATSDDISNKKLNQLDCSFMYTQIMKEILLKIKFDEHHIKEFIQYCRDAFVENKDKLRDVNKLEQEYHKKTPVRWYTGTGFLYPMLNHALRVMNTDVIIKMSFFIGDLHRQIEQLHEEQYIKRHKNDIFTLYRGQGLSTTDFEKISKMKDGLMSFNNFLSTAESRDISMDFARNALLDSDLVGILFIMKIDPSQSATPFASIKDVSAFSHEDEILFSMHSIFRIDDIKPMVENSRLFQVDLTLTSDDDKDLRVLSERIREEIDPKSTEWGRLGKLLLKLGHPDKAQHLYEVLLDQATNELEKAHNYYHIGLAKYHKGEFKMALVSNAKALKIWQHSLPPDHLHLACIYNTIGIVYYSMGEYSKAVLYYEKCLKIEEQSLPPNDPRLANSYNSVGCMYSSMGEYSKALSSHEIALGIQQQSLPLNHPNFAKSYNSIGGVYGSMGEYSKALSFHEKALGIRQQSLPLNHPELGTSYNSIAGAYYSMGEYLKALSYYKKVLEIQQQSLSSNHPSLAAPYNNIGEVYRSMGEYSKALSSHEKALEIQQQSLPPDHPDLAISNSNIGSTYSHMGEYLKALSYYERALEIRQQSLPPNHPHLACFYNNIGTVYYNMSEYSKARSFLEQAVNIGQQSLPSNHPQLKSYRNSLAKVKKKL